MAATVRTQYRWMSGQMVFRYGWRQAALTVGVAAALLWMLLMGRTQGWEMHRDCMDRAWHQGLKTVEAAQLACSRPRF